MVLYHFFKTEQQAGEFIAQVRANGGLCYGLGMTCGEYEVRVVSA